jgi:hypothetical protein
MIEQRNIRLLEHLLRTRRDRARDSRLLKGQWPTGLRTIVHLRGVHAHPHSQKRPHMPHTYSKPNRCSASEHVVQERKEDLLLAWAVPRHCLAGGKRLAVRMLLPTLALVNHYRV